MDKVDDLIGAPFEYGGRGPDKFDCYGLLMELYRRRGIALPDFTSYKEGGKILAQFAAGISAWQECAVEPGAAVLIRVPGSMHVGMALDDRRFIHTWERSGGVVIERLDTWEWRTVGFYRYAG